MKLCTFSKEAELIRLQYIDLNTDDTMSIIKEIALTHKDNIERIQYLIESHLNTSVSESQKYFIEKNRRGVLKFL